MGKLALPPGFRFHPTDEELVSYYLKRKVYGRKIEFEAIGDLDLYKFEPWDLPELARLQTRDLEWYFFCPRDKKYPNGSRTNRATENGYWKATGKDRAVSSRSVSVGMKKTLVYYKGRAPKGERTNWVMHEYRLEDSEWDQGETLQNCFVLCRIYQKSGTGPKNGEQYGAPVEEEEWETAPIGETEDISGLGTTPTLGAYGVQDALHSVRVSGEQLCKEAKKVSLNGISTGHVVLKADPEDVKVFEREEMKVSVPQFTNLPVAMLAEPHERELRDGHVANVLDEELEHSADLIAMYLSPPDDGEEEILEEIQGLVATSNECNHQVVPRGEAHLEARVQVDETGCHLPQDGDFFELNDLSPILDPDEMLVRTSARQDLWATSGGGDIHLQHSCSLKLQQETLEETLPGICSDDGYTSEFANAAKLESISEDVQVQAPLTSWSLDSYGQAAGECPMDKFIPYSGLYGAVSESFSTEGEELENKDIPDFFTRYNTLGGERESYNAEFDGGRLRAGDVQKEGLVLHQAGSGEQDDQYLDAFSSFPGMVDMNLLNAGWAAKKAWMQPDNSTKAGSLGMDMVTRNNSAGAQTLQNSEGTLGCKPGKRSEAAKASDGRGTRTSKAIGALLHYLESLPTLPASAADMSSRSGTPLGSISVLASSVDIRAVSIDCSCVNNGAASSCMTCSFEKRGTFVRSLSYTGARMVVAGSSTSFLALAVMGVIWAFFWFLIVGGSWKLLWGVFRLIFSR